MHELARLYRLVRQLVDYFEAKEGLPELRKWLQDKEQALATQRAASAPAPGQKADKKLREAVQKLERSVQESAEETQNAENKIAAVDDDPMLAAELAAMHPDIGRQTQAETAKLHANDAENLALWREFMPYCLEDIDRIYRRLSVKFDHTLGESFYHSMLPGVVEDLRRRGIAQESKEPSAYSSKASPCR